MPIVSGLFKVKAFLKVIDETYEDVPEDLFSALDNAAMALESGESFAESLRIGNQDCHHAGRDPKHWTIADAQNGDTP